MTLVADVNGLRRDILKRFELVPAFSQDTPRSAGSAAPVVAGGGSVTNLTADVEREVSRQREAPPPQTGSQNHLARFELDVLSHYGPKSIRDWDTFNGWQSRGRQVQKGARSIKLPEGSAALLEKAIASGDVPLIQRPSLLEAVRFGSTKKGHMWLFRLADTKEK